MRRREAVPLADAPDVYVSNTKPEALIPNRVVRGMSPDELQQMGNDIRAGHVAQIHGELLVTPVRQPLVLVLPEPPAANRYLRRHGNVTYKTREAAAYCKLVYELTEQHRKDGRPAFPEGDIAVVVVWRRSRRAGDLGERTKVLYDALQGTVYADDKQIAQDWRRRCDEHPTLQPGTVRIEISALPA